MLCYSDFSIPKLLFPQVLLFLCSDCWESQRIHHLMKSNI